MHTVCTKRQEPETYDETTDSKVLPGHQQWETSVQPSGEGVGEAMRMGHALEGGVFLIRVTSKCRKGGHPWDAGELAWIGTEGWEWVCLNRDELSGLVWYV